MDPKQHRNPFSLSRLSLALLGSMGLAISTGAIAATIPQAAQPGRVDRPTIEKPQAVDEDKAPAPGAAAPEFQAPEGADQLVATLTQINFSGELIFDEAKLQKVAEGYLNRPLTREDIARLKYDLTKLYFDKGYVLVKVTTPPQDLSDGSLDVRVFTGHIGNLETEGGELLSERVTAGLTQRIVKGEVFREQTVETVLQDINDINNIKARLNLRPGSEVGTTDLRLIMEEADQDVQTFMLDNYGSDLTGRAVAELDLEKSNLMKQGERLGLNLRVSEDHLHSVRGDIAIPTGLGNWVLEANAQWSENDIGGPFAGIQASGESRQIGVAVSSNLVNQQQRKGTIRFGLERREHESFLSGTLNTEDDITQIYAEGSYLKRAPRYVYYSSLRLSKGMSWLGADPIEANNSRGTGDPRAWILQAVFFGNYRFTENDNGQFFLRAQKSPDVLLSSDMFSVGGYNNVRGFEPALIAGDEGITASIQWDHRFPSANGWDFQAGPFFDWGTVGNHVATTGDATLKSVGLGGEAFFKGNGKFSSKLRLDWAHTIGDYTDTRVDDNFFYFRFTQTF